MQTSTDEYRVVNALLEKFSGDSAATPEKIRDFAVRLASVYNVENSLEDILEEVRNNLFPPVEKNEFLTDATSDHNIDWIRDREIPDTYSSLYSKYLIKKGWRINMANSLVYDDCNSLLSLLQDPQATGSWKRRGLVIGHVQSGKTAHYIGLICRAADAGYKLIIVLSGVHNNLRRQTQQRIDEGFIGRSGSLGKIERLGVGDLISTNKNLKDHKYPWSLTDLDNDLKENPARGLRSGIKHTDIPKIIVMKKNVTTLKVLEGLLNDAYTDKAIGKCIDDPLLMIDDEADNASINTNEEEVDDPTRINSQLRGILGLFAKSCYVGYTATPFANIFINPYAVDRNNNEDLFPKDFIYLLNAPPNYFGPQKIFCEEETSQQVLRIIDDCEEIIPLSPPKDLEISDLPSSLKRAIFAFILARAIRNLRGQAAKHCSMLINVSHLVEVQNSLRMEVNSYLLKLRDAVRWNYKLDDSDALENPFIKQFKTEYENEYSDTGQTWEAVKSELKDAVYSIQLFLVNIQSDVPLDYQAYGKKGEGLTALVIGGFSLSRGLTIEGLTISYLHRNSKQYDTLMQMGRWFGYRPGYEDLCRIYLRPEAIDWYTHITEATECIRAQVREMRITNRSPSDFGLYVESHPDSLRITSHVKMRSGKKIKQANLSGYLQESFILTLDKDVNSKNELLIDKYWNQYFKDAAQDTGKGRYVADVDVRVVMSFINEFQSHHEMQPFADAAVNYLRAISDVFKTADVLLISKVGKKEDTIPLIPQERNARNAEVDKWVILNRRVGSPGDEKLGLSQEQVEAAMKLHGVSKSSKVPDWRFREIRNKPLLMIHIITPKDNEEFAGMRVPSWGLSFPFGEFDHFVKGDIYANVVLQKQYDATQSYPYNDYEVGS